MSETACGERLAAIDIGTNSTRLLVATIKEGGAVYPLFVALKTTRIGEGSERGRPLLLQPVRRTLAVLAEYRKLLQQYGVKRWRIVATAAVREAANRAEFVALVRSELGWEVEVIPGEEEAYLSYLGACRALPGVERALVIDIGGGSTEFTWPVSPSSGITPQPPKQVTNLAEKEINGGVMGATGKVLHSISVPLGAVRLTEQPRLRAEMASYYREPLRQIRHDGVATLVGVGGTVTTLAAVDQQLVNYDRNRVHGYRLKRQAVDRILSELAAKDIEERKSVPGLLPERADIIVAGTAILQYLMAELAAATIIVSEADLLYGMIRELWTSC